jgi:uncharacterized protein (DUF1697 family)
MKTFIALLRGINVGGKNKLPMKELKTLLEQLDLQNIRTYIQSGNVVFESPKSELNQLAVTIREAINTAHGFDPNVLLLPAEAFAQAIKANPFPEAEADPKSLHLSFLTANPEQPDLAGMENIRTETERFILRNRVFYLHAPDGIGRSKLAARVEKLLGVPATSRNWRTVNKIMEMVSDKINL